MRQRPFCRMRYYHTHSSRDDWGGGSGGGMGSRGMVPCPEETLKPYNSNKNNNKSICRRLFVNHVRVQYIMSFSFVNFAIFV